jgi:hypothetical protein
MSSTFGHLLPGEADQEVPAALPCSATTKARQRPSLDVEDLATLNLNHSTEQL